MKISFCKIITQTTQSNREETPCILAEANELIDKELAITQLDKLTT